jgi:hypothetical protein
MHMYICRISTQKFHSGMDSIVNFMFHSIDDMNFTQRIRIAAESPSVYNLII